MRMRELLWLGVIAILVIFRSVPAGGGKRDASYPNFKMFVSVLESVKRNYVNDVDDEKLFYGAYRGMLAELDPYNQFMTPEDVKQLEADTEGEFGGLGIEITLDNNRILTVITPIEDTPAAKAGVQPGDRIVEIEGKSTYNMTLMNAVNKLRGRPGTPVTITVIHEGTGRRERLTITRDIIKVHSIRAVKLVDEKAKIGYIRMTNFQKTTAEELDKAVRKLVDQGMKALVLDLRRNPGGLLDASVAVCDRFIQNGVLVTTRGRAPDTVHRFEATHRNTYSNFPVAVLISGSSASASEIVAGCLQDHHRAIIVGMRSFGKGSVQSILMLDDGCKLRLTTAKYYTPSGRCIHRDINAVETDPWGILPDIEVKTTYDEELGLLKHWQEESIKENATGKEPPKPEKQERPEKPETPEKPPKPDPTAPAPAPVPEDEDLLPPARGERGTPERKEFVDRTLVRAMDALKAILVYTTR
jgi:carboxyl-terminal processing protease